MNFERAYYDQPDVWGHPPAPYQVQVRDDVLARLPRGVRTVLDVGCGDGHILGALPGNLKAVGLDLSPVALEYVRRPKVSACVSALPFPDGSFDLVMAHDVIEHLTENVYTKGLEEMARVAEKHIMVTAPFMEDLSRAVTRCGACGLVFHMYHHFRRFDPENLGRLFAPAFEPQVFLFTGEARASDPGAQLKKWDKAVCPGCGARASTDEPAHNGPSGPIEPGPRSKLPAWLKPARTECLVVYSAANGQGAAG